MTSPFTVSFKELAFNFQFTSEQVDEVYNSLNLFDRGEKVIPISSLERIRYNPELPKSFTEYLVKFQQADDLNIVFESRTKPSTEPFHDWDLLSYD